MRAARGGRLSYGEGMGFGALGFLSVAVISVFSSFLIARLYGVDVIGEYALVLAPSSAMWFLSSAREQAALVRELATCEPRAPRVTGLATAVMAFSACLTVVVAVLALIVTYFVYSGPIGKPGLFAPAAANMAGYVVFTNTCWNADMVLGAFRAGRVLFWLRLHQMLAYAAFATALSYLDSSVWGITLATIGSWFTVTVHRAFTVGEFMRWHVSAEVVRDGFRALPDLLRFGIRVVPGSIADGISQEVSIWVLGIMAPIAAVGAFSRAWLLSRRMIDLNYRITEMLFPTLVERHASGDQSGFDSALVETLRLATYCLLLPAAAAGGAAPDIMAQFGPGFAVAAPALAILLTVPALSLMSQVQTHALLAVNRPLTSSKISIVRMFITVVGCIVLVNEYGIVGAAAAVVLGYVVDLGIRLWITRGLLDARLSTAWPPRTVFAVAVAYVAGFVVARAVDSAVPGLPGALCALAAGSVAYLAALAGSGGLLPRDRKGLRAVWERITKGRAESEPDAEAAVRIAVREARSEAEKASR